MTSLRGSREDSWNASYRNGDNFVFYPHEEVIRFVSRHFRKQIGAEKFLDRAPFSPAPRSLDLGCGIGRHVDYLHDVGFDSHGIDLSKVAVELARERAAANGMAEPSRHILCGSAESLPWRDGFFRCVVSHGVLDSVPFSIAKKIAREIGRVSAADGLVYVDLISSDDHERDPSFTGEEELDREHERGTIQSYFDPAKIQELFDGSGLFVHELTLVRRHEMPDGPTHGRYHVTLERRA